MKTFLSLFFACVSLFGMGQLNFTLQSVDQCEFNNGSIIVNILNTSPNNSTIKWKGRRLLSPTIPGSNGVSSTNFPFNNGYLQNTTYILNGTYSAGSYPILGLDAGSYTVTLVNGLDSLEKVVNIYQAWDMTPIDLLGPLYFTDFTYINDTLQADGEANINGGIPLLTNNLDYVPYDVWVKYSPNSPYQPIYTYNHSFIANPSFDPTIHAWLDTLMYGGYIGYIIHFPRMIDSCYYRVYVEDGSGIYFNTQCSKEYIYLAEIKVQTLYPSISVTPQNGNTTIHLKTDSIPSGFGFNYSPVTFDNRPNDYIITWTKIDNTYSFTQTITNPPSLPVLQTIVNPNLEPGNYNVNILYGIGCSVNVDFNVPGQYITLNEGWNLFSTYVLPKNPNIVQVLNGIKSKVKIVKDIAGQMYWPQFNINNIGNIKLGDGYLIKMIVSDTLIIRGHPCQPELSTILLDYGWNFIGYLRTEPGPINQMLSQISSNIDIIKDVNGQIYWPQSGISQITNMYPGQAYYLKLNSSATLTYPPNSSSFYKSFQANIKPQFFHLPNHTDNNMTLGLHLPNLPDGTEVGVFSQDGLLVGAGISIKNMIGLAIHGDDMLTPEIDGLKQGEKFTIYFLNPHTQTINKVQDLKLVQGLDIYEPNQIIEGIIDNPFNLPEVIVNQQGEITINAIGLDKEEIQMDIFNISGQIISSYSINIGTTYVTQARGVVLIRLMTKSTCLTYKLII